MSSETIQTIIDLVEQIRDENKPEPERRAALRHVCVLKGEPALVVQGVPAEDLRFVAAAIRPSPSFGIELFERGLSVADAIDAVATGRVRRENDRRR